MARPRGRREKWPGIHCLRMREKPHDLMGYRIPSFTNRYSLPYSSEARPSRAYPANMAGKSEDFDKALKFALCCIGKGDFTLKAEQLDAIKYIYDEKDVFLWLPTGFGKSICYETLPFVLNYKHSDGGIGGGCSVVLVMLPLVSLMVDQVYQAVYLVWLFLRITTTCNLSIIGLVRRRFLESFLACANSGYQATFPSSHVAWVRGYY